MTLENTKHKVHDTEGFHVLNTQNITRIQSFIILFFVLYFPSFLLFNQCNFNPLNPSLEKI